MADKHLDPGFGRDGISGLLSPDRVLRAREVSRPRRPDAGPTTAAAPTPDDGAAVRDLIARASGRRPKVGGAGL